MYHPVNAKWRNNLFSYKMDLQKEAYGFYVFNRRLNSRKLAVWQLKAYGLCFKKHGKIRRFRLFSVILHLDNDFFNCRILEYRN